MDKIQEYMVSRAGEEAEEVGASNTGSPFEVESSCVVVEKLTPDKLISQGEEEYSFGLGRLFREEEKELEVGMETDQAE